MVTSTVTATGTVTADLTTPSPVRVRLFATGAVLAGLVLCASACSDATSSTRPSTGAPASTADGTSPMATATATTVPGPVITIDAPSTLQQGLAGLVAGYHFLSVVTVNGLQTLVADGDHVGGSSRLTLAADGGTVAYIITPQGSYAQPEFGDWELLEVPPATADPIAALATPLAIAIGQFEAGIVVLRVTVTAVSLGIAAEGNADVDVSLLNGVITRITYSTGVEGGTATVVSDIGPLIDTTPIVAPI